MAPLAGPPSPVGRARLRERSLAHRPTISAERAVLLTDFYGEHAGRYPVPILRALAFRHLCEHKTVWIGDDELIVGERGPEPLAVPTFPELTCHTVEDLQILDSREKTSYAVPPEVIDAYRETVIPYWQGRSLRERIFPMLPQAWHEACSKKTASALSEAWLLRSRLYGGDMKKSRSINSPLVKNKPGSARCR